MFVYFSDPQPHLHFRLVALAAAVAAPVTGHRLCGSAKKKCDAEPKWRKQMGLSFFEDIIFGGLVQVQDGYNGSFLSVPATRERHVKIRSKHGYFGVCLFEGSPIGLGLKENQGTPCMRVPLV